jgi:hypothetical protein
VYQVNGAVQLTVSIDTAPYLPVEFSLLKICGKSAFNLGCGSCIFADLKRDKLYAERTVSAFERLLGLEMHEPKFHGGIGNC